MSYTLGQPVINLGSYGKLIYPVKVDGGRWYYFWDYNGDGTYTINSSADQPSGITVLNLFNKNSNGTINNTGETNLTYRYATLNGVVLALPTYGGANSSADLSNGKYASGTTTGSDSSTNNTYDDLLAIWDNFNGTTSGINLNGLPSNWPGNTYLSATPAVSGIGTFPSFLGHVVVDLMHGYVSAAPDTNGSFIALEVFASTSPTPTYSIASNQLSVNEGSTATFTLTTTNVASGTSVPYTLSGISAADVSGGSLSGNAVVNSSGLSTISVALLNDSLTEGTETLTVTAGGASVSTVVNDTSKAPTQVTVTEFAFEFPGKSPLTKPPYAGSVSTAEYVEFSLLFSEPLNTPPIAPSLSFVLGAQTLIATAARYSGSTITFRYQVSAQDLDADGIEIKSLNLNGGVITSTSGGTVNPEIPLQYRITQLSVNSLQPRYAVTSSAATVNEGSTATFTLTTTNVASGTSVPYTLSGISAADVSGGSLSGNAVVNSSGVATISVSLLNDSLTEGSETLTVTAGGATASSVINDTSKAPTYSIYAGNASYNEGSRAEFNFSATNVSAFTALTYTISGVSSSDVSYPLSGTIQFSSGPYGYTFYIPLANDELTEGDETLTVSIGGVSASAVVKDTSRALVSYQLNATSTSVDEGGFTQFILYTKNVAIGTTINYSLAGTGITSSDIVGGSLSGTAVVASASFNGFTGGANINIYIAADNFTEGAESLEVYSQGQSSNIGIRDTSTTLIPTYSLQSLTGGSVNEGTTATFTLTTTNVASGTSVPYTLSGISAADVSGGSLSGNAVVNSSGVATISVALLNDSLTEGTETLTVSAGGASATTLIYDSSKTPSYTIYAGYTSYNEGTTVGFYLETTNVDSGTALPYTLSGVNSADITGGSLTGTTIVGTNGNQKSVIYVSIANDNLTEGNETLTLTINGVSASTTINDTSKSAVTPSYSLVASIGLINEGSTATFILTTSNVTAGTSVSYTISGISASDVSGGSLSGMTTVASNGQATITVLLANDNLTEGTETLTVTAGGASASTQINDTSKAASATYAVSTNWTTTTEGTPIVVTLSTSNVAAGTTLYYQLSGSGITTSDFGGLSLTGSSVINSSGQASLTIPLSADTTTEGDETFVIQYYTDSGRSITAGSAAYVTILDTSKGAVTPTYAVSTNSSSVNEGSTADFTITTSNVSAGTSIGYTLSGVSSLDITGGSLTGFATVNSIGNATVSIPIAADTLTEGTETLTISLQGKTASVQINDTSKAAVVPTYALVASSSSVNEGSVALFNLTTTGVSPGTSVPFTISGVSTSDVTGGLSGTATVDTNGLASISVPIAADFLTEGSETLTVTAQGKSASVVISDTSKTTLVPSYALSASTNSVSEGSNAVFTLTTTNVTGGTSIPYTISGVSSADITGGAMSGTAIVSSNGNATITIPIASDLTTEGTESLTVTAQGISSSVLISDTSITPVVVAPISNVTSIPYGDGKYFYGSSGSDKVTGTSFVDVVKQTSTISSNQLTKLSDGSWQIQNKITPSNSDNLVNVERVEFNDMSVALDVSGPAGQVAKILGSVFGPSYVSNTEFAGIGFAYLDGGMSYLDLCGLAAGAAKLGTPDLLVTTLLRNTTGTEPTALSKSSYLQSISSGASYASVVQQIADSSANAQSIKLTDLANTGLAYTPYVLPPTYSLSAATASVNEGSTAVFNLTTTNVAVGTEVSYTLSGVGTSDLTSSTLTGKVTIGVGGLASISIPIAADGATEGQETLTVNAQGATASIVVNDTSKGNATPTYSLIAGSSSVDEGASVRVIVNTTNVAAGTSLEYGISGINITTDDLQGGLKGIAVVDSLGMALINLLTIADLTTEGSETMVIRMGPSDAQIVINDTSITLVGIPEGGGGDGGGGGGGSGGSE